MQHHLCKCGHEKSCHGVHGQACIGCDCDGFTLVKKTREKRLKVRHVIKRLTRKFDMNN